MHFEARELKPYAEAVTAEELKEGAAYFSVTFYDDDMLIPDMKTMIFIGNNLEKEDTNSLYFQDVDSYKRGARYGSAKDGDATFYKCSSDQLSAIFDFEHALEELMRCALARKKSSL